MNVKKFAIMSRVEISMKEELISVVMPVYNTDKYITEAINSVLNQTYGNLELIIVNDASTDNSSKIINSFESPIIKCINLKKNSGAAAARNVGIEAAKGNIICFIDSDDIWERNKLQRQYSFLKENGAGFVYTKYKNLYKNGTEKEIKFKFNKLKYEDLLKNTEIGTSTVMINTNIIKKDLILMNHLGTCEDTATWLRITKNGYEAYMYDEVLVTHRVRRGSLSYNKVRTAINMLKIYRKQEGQSILNTISLFLQYEKNALVKRI